MNILVVCEVTELPRPRGTTHGLSHIALTQEQAERYVRSWIDEGTLLKDEWGVTGWVVYEFNPEHLVDSYDDMSWIAQHWYSLSGERTKSVRGHADGVSVYSNIVYME